MASLDIQPEELINNLSQQLGALISENTALKMALGKQQDRIAALEAMMPEQAETPEEEPSSKKKKSWKPL